MDALDLSRRQFMAAAATTAPRLAEGGRTDAGDRPWLGPISVRQFGAVGDGKRDDTRAIQAALDTAPSGSTILVPRGSYLVTGPLSTGNKTLILQGEGYRASVGTDMGDEQFRRPSTYSGSVIFSTVQSGPALDLNPLSSWAIHLRDLALVGPGSGSATGIRARSSAPRNSLVGCLWWNVGVFNFHRGVELAAVLNSNFTRLRVVGCNTGCAVLAYDTIGSNNNTFVDFESYFTGSHALYSEDSAGLRLIGPLIQNMKGAGIVFAETAPNNNNDNIIINPWLEHGGRRLQDSILVTGGRNTHIYSAHGAGSARIVFAAGVRHRLIGARFTGAGNVVVVGEGASDCVLEGLDLESGGTVLDRGLRTRADHLQATATATELAEARHPVNSRKKEVGKLVWDSTHNRMVRASGNAPTDSWHVIDGSSSIRPT